MNAIEFAKRVAEQTPEKPDHWCSCSQCERNIELAKDVVESGDLFPIFDILPRLWDAGYTTYVFYRLDGTHDGWQLYDPKGDVILKGDTFRELCVNIVLAGL